MKGLLDMPAVTTRGKTEREPFIYSSQGVDLQKRVIIICPHVQFSTAFTQYLKRADPAVDIDDISDASLPDEPYVDVKQREQGRKSPSYIIDFLHLNQGEKMVKFSGYQDWALGKYNAGVRDHVYFNTNGRLDQAIESQEAMRSGNLGRYGFDIRQFEEEMKNDAYSLMRGNLQQLRLLHNFFGFLDDVLGTPASSWKESEE